MAKWRLALWGGVFALVAGVLLLSCEDGAQQRPAVGKDTKEFRQTLIDGLQEVRAKIAGNDKDSVATLFPIFPVPDTMWSIYVNDSLFDRRIKEGHALTREVFDRWFGKIGQSWELDEFRRVFENLDLQKLIKEDRIKKENIVKDEPCYRYYSIEIGADSIISINYGTNNNPAFKHAKGGALADDEICEHAIIWQFRSEHGKLRLVRQTAAG